MDRHMLWRRVGFDYEQLKEIAPDGFEPVVEVFVHGRLESIEPNVVETRRGDGESWIRIEASNRPHPEEGKAHPDDSWIHVREDNLSRVEITYRKKDTRAAIGFHHEIAEDPPQPDS